MLHVFSTNRVKLMARKPKATDNLRGREYKSQPGINELLQLGSYTYSCGCTHILALFPINCHRWFLCRKFYSICKKYM